jgi:hypothetical protein
MRLLASLVLSLAFPLAASSQIDVQQGNYVTQDVSPS